MPKKPTIADRALLLIQQAFSGEIMVTAEQLRHHQKDLKAFGTAAARAGAELLAYTTGLEPPANRVAQLAATRVALDFGDEVQANDAILWAFADEDERRAFCAATGAIAWLA